MLEHVEIDLTKVKGVKLNDKCRFDLEQKCLYYKDKQVDLGKYEEDVLEYLILKNGRAKSWDEIHYDIMGDDSPSIPRKSVTSAVGRIHNEINPDKEKITDENKPKNKNEEEKRKYNKNTLKIIKNKRSKGYYIEFTKDCLIYKPAPSENDVSTNQADDITNIITNEDEEAYDLIRQQIADAYYAKYKNIYFGDSKEETKRSRRSLIDVFLYPDFVDDKELDLANNNPTNSNIYYICAPNGFGKTTLLKAILFSTNPPTNLKYNDRIKDLQKIYNIKKESLTLFVDISPIRDIPEVKIGTELSKWLLKASDIQGHNGFRITTDEFREVISYFNERDNLILIFDGIDELREKAREEVDRIDIINKIKELIEGDSICKNAKVIIAARPMVSGNINLPYEYYNIEPLTNNQDKVKRIIDKYSPEYAKKIKEYIFKDRYLENLVATPQLLSELIYRFIVNKENEKKGKDSQGKIEWDNENYKIIKTIISGTITRFKSKGEFNYRDNIYQPIYETFSYASLFHRIPNGERAFSICANIIKHYELKSPGSSRIDINEEHLKEAYEHYSLFDTQNDELAFLAPITLRAYYLANYICVYYKDYNKSCDSAGKWDKIEAILENEEHGEEYLCDMLVFYFGLMIDGGFENIHLVQGSDEYDLWTDYIVYKLKDENTNDTLKEKIKESLKYLINERFVKTTFFNNILADPESENEEYLRSILNEIMKK